MYRYPKLISLKSPQKSINSSFLIYQNWCWSAKYLLVVLLAGLFVVCQPYQVHALSGVGAKIDRVSKGTLVRISGRTSPNAEIVVLDSTNRVVASAKDQGLGDFNFTFTVPTSSLNSLRLISVDAASETNPISVPPAGLSGVLLPPSLVIDPEFEEGDDTILIGGYSFPGSTLAITIENNAQVIAKETAVAGGDGAWEIILEDLPSGNYTVFAVADIDGLDSQPSNEITFVVEAPTPNVARNVTKQVSTVVENVVTTVVPPTIREAVEKVSPEAEQVNQAVTPVASASLLAQIALAMRDLMYLLIQTFITGMQYFGFWRKKHPWGVVYDALTKQPINLVTVRLYSVGTIQKLVETDVTSKAGVFSFIPEAGDYIIKVAKTGYQFPSRLILGNTDGEYAEVYHGEKITFGGSNSVVEVSVPLDPEEVNLTWQFKVVRFVRSRIYYFTISMLVIGLIMSLIAVVGGQGGFNGLLLVFYASVLVGHAYSAYKQSRAWGKVLDIQGNLVKGVQLDLVDPKFEKLVQRRVTDEKGKYQFVVPEGQYELRIGSPEYDLITGFSGAYQGEKIVVEGDKPQLIAVRIRIQKRQ